MILKAFIVNLIKLKADLELSASVNTDQGCQFTSGIFTALLTDNKIQISMDVKGRAIDNIFIERLWRTV
ncbi:hypothetical protein BH11BAC5_BH11BAC5_35050 [soil metagenome]